MGKNTKPICLVKGCRNNKNATMTYRNPDNTETLHSFPRDKYRRLQWSNAVGVPEVMNLKHKMICSLHFEEGAIVPCKNEGRKRVLPGFLPTIFPDYDPSLEKPPSTPKRKRNRKKAESKSPKNSDYESDNNRNSDYVSDNRNTDYDSEEDYRIGEYISENNMAYISTTGKRSNPLQPIRVHQSPHTNHMPSLTDDPWGGDYDANNYGTQYQSPTKPYQSPRPSYQSPRQPYQSPRPPHQSPRPRYQPPKSHSRVKTILTPARPLGKKKARRSVTFEDPAQAALRELRENRDQQQQMQFSLMSFAPIEIDQSTSFAAPADNEIQQLPTATEPATPTTPVKRTVDSAVAAEVYKKQIEVLEKKYKTERERAVLFKKKFIAADTVNRRNVKKILELTGTITKLKKQVAVPVFTLKDKNIKLTFT